MDKKSIREEILTIRNSLSLEDVINRSKKIASNLMLQPEFDEADNILLYADYRHEVMTKDIFDAALLKKKNVFFPKCMGKNMIFKQVVNIGELAKGAWGINEPMDFCSEYIYDIRENTLVIVPGVAFDVSGFRIGYGQGYYDRFLADKPYLTKIGLAFSNQIVEVIPHDSFDCKMDKIVSEELVYSILRI